MLSQLWNLTLITPLLNVMVGLFKLTGNLGVSILLLTLLVRTLLIPVVLPSMKNMQKQRDLQPELEKLRKKYKHDKQKQAELQMELFKKHGLNPASGCLSQLAMIVVLIALYGVITRFSGEVTIADINALMYLDFLKLDTARALDTAFIYLDLAKPDPYFAMPVLAGILQFFASKMMQPYTLAGEEAAKKTPDKQDDFAYNMQEQMLYMMPIMTVIISLKLPAGAVLYILVTTVFTLVQQYFVSGLGGLTPLLHKLGVKK